MAQNYLKSAPKTSRTDAASVTETVRELLDTVEAGGDDAAKALADKFDNYGGPVLLSADDKAAAAERVPMKLKDDIRFAHDNIRRFAEAQRNAMQDFEVVSPPDDSVSSLAFSPASIQQNFLVAGSWDCNVRCWEVEQSGKTVPKSMQSMAAPVLAVCWSDVSPSIIIQLD